MLSVEVRPADSVGLGVWLGETTFSQGIEEKHRDRLLRSFRSSAHFQSTSRNVNLALHIRRGLFC